MIEDLVAYGLSDFEREQLAPDEAEAKLARVTEVQRSNLKVVTESGERRLEWSAKQQQAALVDRPTVGDWVLLDDAGTDIARVLKRRSLFKRAAAGRGDEIQPIAANVDTVLIVSSCNEEFKESRLERYLALCREANSEPLVVLTKADLCTEPETYRQRAEAVQAGLEVVAVNARDAEQLDGIRGRLAPRTTAALVGSSGVGKSTLLNALAGSELAATQGIREGDKKGRHTTTHRSLYRVPGDLLIIDVPGMRELRVAEADDALLDVFDDIEELARGCRFKDCAHEAEPGCAVKKAISEGKMDDRRLASYRKLQLENAEATATIAERRTAGKGLARKVAGAKRWKQRQRDGDWAE